MPSKVAVAVTYPSKWRSVLMSPHPHYSQPSPVPLPSSASACTDPCSPQEPSTLQCRPPAPSLWCCLGLAQGRLDPASQNPTRHRCLGRAPESNVVSSPPGSPQSLQPTGEMGMEMRGMKGALSRESPNNPPRRLEAPSSQRASLTHLSLSHTNLPLQILGDHFPSEKENAEGTAGTGSLLKAG